MEWYYADGGQRVGPIQDSQFQALVAGGTVRPETLVWRAGMTEWQPLSRVQPSQAAIPTPSYAAPAPVPAPGPLQAPGVAFCTECGRQYPASELLVYGTSRVCVLCKDVFFQRVREQGTAAAVPLGGRRFAGFWIRVVAQFLDSFIISIVLVPICVVLVLIAMASGMNFQNPQDFNPTAIIIAYLFIIFFSLALGVFYNGYFVSKKGGTPGKLILNLRIIRTDGSPVSFARAVGRYLCHFLDGMILYIGYIMAGFDVEKRALHDHICDTRVIYKS